MKEKAPRGRWISAHEFLNRIAEAENRHLSRRPGAFDGRSAEDVVVSATTKRRESRVDRLPPIESALSQHKLLEPSKQIK